LSPDPVIYGLYNLQSYNRYSYVRNAPLLYVDLSGYAPNKAGASNASNSNRYFYTDKYGWVDTRHFFRAANCSNDWYDNSEVAETLGFVNEVAQFIQEGEDDYHSGFSPEDLPSNSAGADFEDNYISTDDPVWVSLLWFLEDAGGRNIDDPESGFDDLPDQDPSDPNNGEAPENSNTSSEKVDDTPKPDTSPDEDRLNSFAPKAELLTEIQN